MSELAEIIDEMLSSYAEVERALETIFFGYGDQILLIIIEGDLRVTLMFEYGQDDFDPAIIEGRRLLRDCRPAILLAQKTEAPPAATTPAPQASKWDEFRPKLRAVLARVLNSAQADRVIDRAQESLNYQDNVPDEKITALAESVIAQVPHRGKRQALEAELEDLLDDQSLS